MASESGFVDSRLLDLLVCPLDKGSLVEREDLSGLECSDCGRVYPVKDGIPVMLEDEASPPKKKKKNK
jgi:uncharacterized protein YbaR (Trm112 family)